MIIVINCLPSTRVLGGAPSHEGSLVGGVRGGQWGPGRYGIIEAREEEAKVGGGEVDMKREQRARHSDSKLANLGINRN
jgi:hypothetical protein